MHRWRKLTVLIACALVTGFREQNPANYEQHLINLMKVTRCMNISVSLNRVYMNAYRIYSKIKQSTEANIRWINMAIKCITIESSLILFLSKVCKSKPVKVPFYQDAFFLLRSYVNVWINWSWFSTREDRYFYKINAQMSARFSMPILQVKSWCIPNN